MWNLLLERIRDEFHSWKEQPLAACLFGSAARGEAGSESDIDLLVVRHESRGDEKSDDEWHHQIDQITDRVHAWTGNHCEVLELTTTELRAAATREDRLADDLRADAIRLFGPDIRTLLRTAEQ